MANTDAPRAVRPVEIRWAFWLLVASVAVSIVVGLLNLNTPAYVEQMGRNLQVDYTDPAQAHEITQGSYRTETVVSLVLVALAWLWLAFRGASGADSSCDRGDVPPRGRRVFPRQEAVRTPLARPAVIGQDKRKRPSPILAS